MITSTYEELRADLTNQQIQEIESPAGFRSKDLEWTGKIQFNQVEINRLLTFKTKKQETQASVPICQIKEEVQVFAFQTLNTHWRIKAIKEIALWIQTEVVRWTDSESLKIQPYIQTLMMTTKN